MFGQEISKILSEIEDTLFEFEVQRAEKPNYSIDGFRAATKIFMSVMMDKIYDLQSEENFILEDRIKMVTKCGEDIRQLIKTYTNIDTHTLYK